MSTWIKLCGLSTQGDVDIAVECGVQAVGFVFAKSARQVSPAHASSLVERVPDAIKTVAVMLRPSQRDVDEVLAEFRPDCLQADWQALAQITLPDDVLALPVYRQGDGAKLDGMPKRFVYEGSLSGQGETVDWLAAKPFSVERELVIAGGLHPDNVGEAINVLSPFGVDVSSGIERERGVKDHARMRDFVAGVRDSETRATATML
ncbi:MAG: N-(5'-phosphoribosyl)anthranilate isomerase [Gammaproteobacteria bacterium]